MLPKKTMILGLLSCSSSARTKICQSEPRAASRRRHLGQRIARMAPQHHREIDQVEPAGDAEDDDRARRTARTAPAGRTAPPPPRRARPASSRRPPPARRAGRRRRRSGPPARWRAGTRDGQQMDDRQPQQGDEQSTPRAPRRRGSWRRCRCGRHRPGRAPRIRPMKLSTLSVVPVTSKTNESVLASITLARNTSARRSASTRFSPVLLDLDQRQLALDMRRLRA